MFYNAACDFKPVGFAVRVVVSVAFFDDFAFLTDEKFREMSCMFMITRDKSV